MTTALRDCQCPGPVLRTSRSVSPGGDVWLMAYIEDVGGSPLTEAGVQTITVSVTDVTDRDLEGWSPVSEAWEILPSGVMFDPPVSSEADPRWCSTEYGYNFGYRLPGTRIPGSRNGSTVYEVDVKFDLVDGSAVRHVWELSAAQLLEGDPSP